MSKKAPAKAPVKPPPPPKEIIDDPKNPRILQYEDILQAANVLKSQIKPTPCVLANTQEEFGIFIQYKLEFSLQSGCFKERGALHTLLRIPPHKKKNGITIPTTGNEAIGACIHAKKLGVPIAVVAPYTLPLSKIRQITKLGGKLTLHGSTFSEAIEHARVLANQNAMPYYNLRDNTYALAGVGTLALELLEQSPCTDAILVPIGTGALAAAVATAVKGKKPSCLVYGIESENLGLLTKSLEKGEALCGLPGVSGSLAGNALSVNMIGANAFATLNQGILDRVLLVKEDWIARAMLHLAEREKYIVEGTAACPLAAILGFLVPELKQKNVMCLLTGGNIDSLMLCRTLQRGLAAEGRLVKFSVGLQNKSEAAAELMNLLASRGYNVLTHFIDNCWTDGDTHRAQIKLVVETKNLDHALDLKRVMEREYIETALFDNDMLNDNRCFGSICRDPQGRRSKINTSTVLKKTK